MQWRGVGPVILASMVSGVNCLEPFDEGEAPIAAVFGPETADPAAIPWREGSGPGFVQSAQRLVGFAEGSTVAYWRLDGEASPLIVPAFRLTRDGTPISGARAIIDVIPGELGYGAFWRVYEVEVTPNYAEERIWSRAAVEAGVELGLLEVPVPTETIWVAPLMRRDLELETATGTLTVGWAWFRNQRVSWHIFPQRLRAAAAERRIQPKPSFLVQRISEPFALDEAAEGFDLDGDGRLRTAHEVLPSEAAALCARRLARVSSGLRSIEGPGPVELRSAEDPALQAPGALPVVELVDLGQTVLCPKDLP